MLVRLIFIVGVVAAVGVLTGTIKPKEMLGRVSLPSGEEVFERAMPPSPAEKAYIQMVDANNNRLDALADALSACDPNNNRSMCRAAAAQLLRQLRTFQDELRRADVPASLEKAHQLLTRGVARARGGFRLLQRAVSTGMRRDYLRAVAVLEDAAPLLDRANAELDRQR